MAIVINGSANTIGGLAVGGLPDGCVDTDTLANNAVQTAKLHDDAITSAKMPAGSVLQVASTSFTSTWTEGVSSNAMSSSVTGLQLNFAPTSSTSKVLVLASINASHDAESTTGIVLKVDGTSVGVGNSVGNRAQITSYHADGGLGQTVPIMFLHSPASTATKTYGIVLWNESGSTANMSINYKNDNDADNTARLRGASSMTCMEIAV